MLGAIDLVRVEAHDVVRDVTVACVDSGHAEGVVRAVRALEGVTVDSVSDRTFLMHKGGKIEVDAKLPLKTRDDLSMAYTPGVARVSDGHPRGPRQGVGVDHREQHGGRRLRRHRCARPGRHRSGGRDARDGGQGDAVQGVRRRRRVPAGRSRSAAPSARALALDDLRERGSIAHSACFALAEQASEEAGPARLVFVRGRRLSHPSGDARSSRANARA
jgi:hypothetical protein